MERVEGAGEQVTSGRLLPREGATAIALGMLAAVPALFWIPLAVWLIGKTRTRGKAVAWRLALIAVGGLALAVVAFYVATIPMGEPGSGGASEMLSE
jgi:hypothetical protein